MIQIQFKLVFAVILLIGCNAIMACTLNMGYRTNERLPLINKQPDNSGLYSHLYGLVAQILGCELNILRGPKKRILKMLKKGQIDFYPGFNFTVKRAKHYYYIENGLPGGDIGISRSDLPDITEIRQLKGQVLLSALGAADFVRGEEGIKVHKVREMTIAKAISLLKRKRGDFYIYNKSTLEYYLSRNKISDIKIHPDCCGGNQPLYLAFSRKSSHYEEIPNPDFDPEKLVTEKNFPVLLSPNSLAYQFREVLESLKKSGKIDEIYKHYYNNSP